TGAGPAVMGRLKPGLSLDQADAELIGLARRVTHDYPATNGTLTSAHIQPLLNATIGPQLRHRACAVLTVVSLVVLIACVNVMNMQFERVALRAKEVAVRGAMGVTRWRIVRQMLTESFVIAVFGAIAGVTLAYWAVDMFGRATNLLPFL